ncbi:hypothetical protein DICPUDRAFT_76760 [Dictyostelium purpureum]|uniref:Uncharacterized protein n=1 Tax=Dictyostelium purpureum TaxID=5786 RepID=F0ZEJ4_DICPU|nr:uncharacterized protein DICPUDRAFT_76760 [Dictyostelium purpureum]EGC37658.1 hypothetical protein DICPUDRAFT_76760 [Dictyostelium purpureum]|eukprot:XP_003285846.1 hypothetical protein DICPUDRAFT_76760 [Dictyostelium purpureum]
MNKLITNNGPWLDTWKRMRLLKPEFNSNCKNCNNDIPQTLKHILLDCTDFETIRSDTRRIITNKLLSLSSTLKNSSPIIETLSWFDNYNSTNISQNNIFKNKLFTDNNILSSAIGYVPKHLVKMLKNHCKFNEKEIIEFTSFCTNQICNRNQLILTKIINKNKPLNLLIEEPQNDTNL